MSETFNPNLTLDDLPVPDATRIRILLAACEWLATQRTPTSCFEQAAVNVTARLEGLEGPSSRPVSAKSMQRLYYRWLNGNAGAPARHWGCLLDGRTQAVNRALVRTASPAFRAHLALLAARSKRGARQAVKDLYDEWANCEEIGGYEGCNYKPNMPLPAGWSYDNLLRLMPSKTSLKVLHEGVNAASSQLAQVFGTRAGCWPCSHVMFDDVWLDVLATGYGADGKMQLGRPLQLGCLDMYTGKRLSWVTKLRTRAEDGHNLQLTADEMTILLCDYLYNVGYSSRGTVLVVEHGTAAISREVEEMLAIMTGGLVRVERSGLTGAKQAGAWGGRAIGNPRMKAHLESWHSLLHNCMGSALTQVGRNRREPEALEGVRRATLKLIEAGHQLPAERALALAPYAPSLAEVAAQLVKVVRGINERTDHALEGWRECGFTVTECSLTGQDGTWVELNTLPQEHAALMSAMIASNPQLLRERNLSPQEAWMQSLADPANRLIRFTPAECVALLGTANKFKLRAVGGAFRMDSRRRYHQQLLFSAQIQDNAGAPLSLPEGKEIYGIFSPVNEQLFVLDERDRVLGVAPRINRFPHVDEAAMLREFGRVQTQRAEQLARAANLIAADTAEAEIRKDYNARVLSGRAHDPLGLADEQVMRRAETRQKRLPEPAPLRVGNGGGLGLPAAYDAPGTFL